MNVARLRRPSGLPNDQQPISSRQEAEQLLKSGCETLIGYLRELQAIYGAMNGHERRAAESEAGVVLRLRKVFFHVQAVTSWKVGTHLLHVVAPIFERHKSNSIL